MSSGGIMKKSIIMAVATVAALISINVSASDFCNGFEMGYKTVKGNMVMVPMCPMEPMTPMGSTPYQEGIKAGMNAARTGR
jgi:hypothetical protein